MLIQGTGDARSYNQWRAVGRQVRKGAHAIWIWAPQTRKIVNANAVSGGNDQNEDTDTDTDTNTDKSKSKSTSERYIIAGFRPLSMFRVEDTDGAELPIYEYEPPTAPPLAEVAGTLGLTVQYAAYMGGVARGYYKPSECLIKLYTTDQRTWWHELAHAAHDRWLRSEGRAILSEPRAHAEAVAEAAACVLGGMYGSDLSGNSWRYISGHVGEKNVVKTLMSLAKEVVGTVRVIMAAADVMGSGQAEQAEQAELVSQAA